MTELAWPFVALVGIGALTFVATGLVAVINFGTAHKLQVRELLERVAALEAVKGAQQKLDESQRALLVSVRDELLPKLQELDDRLGRTELEVGVRQ